MFFLGVFKFVYILVYDYNLLEFVFNNGYFVGKCKVEVEIFLVFFNIGLLYFVFFLLYFLDYKFEINLSL